MILPLFIIGLDVVDSEGNSAFEDSIYGRQMGSFRSIDWF